MLRVKEEMPSSSRCWEEWYGTNNAEGSGWGFIFYNNKTPTLIAFTGVTNARDPHPTQQHVGFQHAVWQPQQDVTRLWLSW